MIRIGIVDFDTSHVVEFTKRFNHISISEDQWIDGAKVVVGCPGTSAILAKERVDEYARIMSQDFGVKLVARPEEMLGQIEAVMIESVDGSAHLERARPFLEAGIPTFIDKPFACSISDANELARLAEKHKAPLFSSSSLRYALEVTALKEKESETGKVVGAEAYSPASTHPRNPGLFHYGIHAVETLYAVMGPGCEKLWCMSTEGTDVVTGIWKDSRIGVVRGTRQGAGGLGFIAFCERSIQYHSIDARFIYWELLKRVVEMFQTGTPPLEISETLEIVAFIEAAMKASKSGTAEKIGK